MSLRPFVVLAVLTGVIGSPNIRPEAEVDPSAHPNSLPETVEETEIFGQQVVLAKEEVEEDVMATGELNPSHYPAQRAAKVVQHYLNTRYGSPYRLYGQQMVHSGNAEDVADSGRKYQLEISVQEMISNTTEKCSAEVLFPRGEQQRSAQVQASCEELLKINTKDQEEALYQQYKTNQSLLSAQHLPDRCGHMEPDMKPLWHLCIVASSFVMLNESTENTLYNMAQVANITQLATENDQLKFDCHILLHEMVSQEIIHWKLLFTWSPPEGVKVLQMEQLPHCHHCEKPPNTN
ncbi:latexin isoform X1 [Micropterus salmoides]|uniref:latexin isoform X1 n=2 Tax=Micropterus salmoides TaxID=27706 RepID=UPI0018EC4D55|nr:latexin isoform X1 [Micropterus salmoides]XP_045930038.1 latexin isoform X1 [Micropterus dolomieu]